MRGKGNRWPRLLSRRFWRHNFFRPPDNEKGPFRNPLKFLLQGFGVMNHSRSFSSSGFSGLYIHIPFCRSKCPYCDFYSEVTLARIADFLQALRIEMELVRFPARRFDTVYLGGGTPTVLTAEDLETILKNARAHFLLEPQSEVSIEANPGDFDSSCACSLRDLGINRINLGVQSFEPEVLRFLKRRHSAQEALTAIEECRKAGFDHLGIDLIYGIPGQTLASWTRSLCQAMTFKPEHISCYQLTIEGETPLAKEYHAGRFRLPGESAQKKFFFKTAELLEANGYIHYEVSNFARTKRSYCRHNQKYWNHSPYLGLGPSAHSFCLDRRWWNARSLDLYISSLRSGSLPVAGTEILTREQLQLEEFFLGMRTRNGIGLDSFVEKYGCDLLREKKNLLDKLQEEGLLIIQKGRIYPTRRGFSVADQLALI
jgi:oxygen-independent coproporphyrinogen-3 oxidase